MSINQPITQKRLIPVTEALNYIPLSRSALYAALQKGTIESVRLGRRRFIRSDYLDTLLTSEAK